MTPFGVRAGRSGGAGALSVSGPIAHGPAKTSMSPNLTIPMCKKPYRYRASTRSKSAGRRGRAPARSDRHRLLRSGAPIRISSWDAKRSASHLIASYSRVTKYPPRRVEHVLDHAQPARRPRSQHEGPGGASDRRPTRIAARTSASPEEVEGQLVALGEVARVEGARAAGHGDAGGGRAGCPGARPAGGGARRPGGRGARHRRTPGRGPPTAHRPAAVRTPRAPPGGAPPSGTRRWPRSARRGRPCSSAAIRSTSRLISRQVQQRSEVVGVDRVLVLVSGTSGRSPGRPTHVAMACHRSRSGID